MIQAQPYSVSCSSSSTIQPTTSPSATPQQYQDPSTAPTALKHYQRLLVDGESIRTGEALKELIVFDFNGAQPANGALGGSSKAAVSSIPTRLQTY